jgi:hypothetical protein
MNDDFLAKFRKPPRPAFAVALHERIDTPMKAQYSFPVRRATLAIGLAVALVAAVAFSPTARAAVLTLIRQIGGIAYIGPEEVAGDSNPAAGEAQTVPEEMLSLSDAQAAVPYEIHLPQWVPDGYSMLSTVRVAYFPDIPKNSTTPMVFITWVGSRGPSGGQIQLTIGPTAQWLVDLGHLEEVQVSGQAAGLTTGGWNADTGWWDTSHADLTLTWTRGDVMYQLSSATATTEELIQVAESIP